jgi:glyoxylase-like metal-dependent hydrolase (beta-lactamase superfamily II)
MDQQVPIDPSARAEETEEGKTHGVAPDLAYQRLAIVNVVYFGVAGAPDGEWVLIDAGVMGTTGLIMAAVEQRFGANSRPAAIILTHGHFDHVGALPELAENWDVPIYAHALELPYLDGRASYPAPDPSVGGGMMSTLSPLYPRGPIDVGNWLKPLPADGEVPHMPGWLWIHAPGHTPGQVALWRRSDRALLAADAFITTKQESAYAVATQRPELHGPPMYYTQDWDAARESVRTLAALQPELAITGHGRAMQGQGLREALDSLAQDFDRVAVPERGRYVDTPTSVANGSAYVKPKGS